MNLKLYTKTGKVGTTDIGHKEEHDIWTLYNDGCTNSDVVELHWGEQNERAWDIPEDIDEWKIRLTLTVKESE